MYTKVLVPVDGSDASIRGLQEAIKLVKTQGGQLRLLHIVNEFIPDAYGVGFYTGDLLEGLREGGQKILQQAESTARAQGLEPQVVMVDAIAQNAADIIINCAKEWPADLIVMGTHGRRGIRRLTLGSDAEQVVRMAPVPVLLVRSAVES
jgi:nucleotide-binding universal stress UspA family protein